MFVVIFRATILDLDAQYQTMAERMRVLALSEFGCIEFDSYCEDGQEVALSYWKAEADIKAWRAHPEHIEAQALGKKKWYKDYSVQVAKIEREYASKL